VADENYEENSRKTSSRPSPTESWVVKTDIEASNGTTDAINRAILAFGL
jgi:hypothetical protein